MGAAVCFSSWQGRLAQTEDGGASIRRFLLEPLGADAVLALGYRDNDHCRTAEECGAAKWLHSLRPIAHVSMWRMPTVAELAAIMEALPHWNAIVRAFQNHKVHCRRTGTGALKPNATPYNCTGLFHSNTIFSPVLGDTFNLHELLGLRRCLDAIVAAETRHGMPYSRVVHSRIEYAWLHPHPPLEFLDDAYVWLPSGEDYGGGFNDRHAVLSRSAANVYFGTRWDAILSGEVMRIDPQLRGGHVLNALAIQGDYYVRSVLGANGLHVQRFVNVQALRCCTGPCFTTACYKRVLPTANGVSVLLEAVRHIDSSQALLGGDANGTATLPEPLMRAAAQLTRDAFDAAGGKRLGTLVAAKYRDEAEAAIQHALLLSLPGARFALRVDPKRLNETLRWNRRHPRQLIKPPLAVVAVAPPAMAPYWRPTMLALRVAQRNSAGFVGLTGLGRRRKTVPQSVYVAWEA